MSVTPVTRALTVTWRGDPEPGAASEVEAAYEKVRLGLGRPAGALARP